MKHDFADQHIRLRERIRALETGAHPAKVRQSGFGRNRRWAQLGLRNVTGGGAIYWRVRSDVVYFRTTGLVTVSTTSEHFARIGMAGRPSYPVAIIGSDGTCAVELDPDGRMWVIMGANIHLSKSYSLG